MSAFAAVQKNQPAAGFPKGGPDQRRPATLEKLYVNDLSTQNRSTVFRLLVTRRLVGLVLVFTLVIIIELIVLVAFFVFFVERSGNEIVGVICPNRSFQVHAHLA
jgi:hypothetical protein